MKLQAGFILLSIVGSACTAATPSAVAPSPTGCADVIEVTYEQAGDRTYSFVVTIRSPDEGWDKYADAYEVRSPTGEVLGVRELTHPHVDEQPFTRSLSEVDIGDNPWVEVVAKDSVEGFCGLAQVVSFEG